MPEFLVIVSIYQLGQLSTQAIPCQSIVEALSYRDTWRASGATATAYISHNYGDTWERIKNA